MKMTKLEQIYEGKAKKVFRTDDPAYCVVEYKDDATAFNGLKKGTILGKGAVNNRMTNLLMQMLEQQGIPTHFVKELSDRETMEIGLIENLQREDLNPMEEAEGYQTLMQQYNMTQEETAQRVGKSRSAVANAMRLLKLCPPVRAMVEDGRLSSGHARAILPLSPAMQESAANAIIKDELSVRQTEQLVKKLTAPPKPEQPEPDGLSVDYAKEAAKELGSRLGRGCRIVTGRKKGRIELEYYGVEDLNQLLDALHALKTK